jgi:hypothetical protein
MSTKTGRGLGTPAFAEATAGAPKLAERRRRDWGLGIVIVTLLAVGCAKSPARVAPAAPAAPAGPDPAALARVWDQEHVSSPLSPLVDHAEVVRRLDDLRRTAPDLFAIDQIGQSLEGRSINHVRLGRGPFVVLLWSQMHGDEPSATSALFDLFAYVQRHRDEPMVRRLLDALTIHVVPMLNPDGAARFQRRNVQSIDINRDALLLQTPEGQLLKSLRDRLNPAIGFNLHNQSWRTSVGRPPKPASISLLSVAFDEARTMNAGRTLTKQTCAIIRDALEPLAPGQIGRYDDEFEVRAFGDNVTKWGTPVVLVETGPWPAPGNPDPYLVRLNFVAILTALDALASGRVRQADPARYESLPMNESQLFYILVQHASIVNGAGIPPFTGDIGIVANRMVADEGGRKSVRLSLRIDDLGDLRTYGAIETIDATGLVAAPLFAPDAKPGDEVSLPAWTAAQKNAWTLEVGQAGGVMLLSPLGAGRYRVERVIRPAVTLDGR